MKRRVPRLHLRPDLEKTKKRRRQPERALQISCMATLRAVLRPDVVVTAIGHQGVGARHGALLRDMGVAKGIFDCVIFWRTDSGLSRTLWCEFKSGTGRMTPEQRIWGERVKALGHWIGIVRSQDDLIQILNEWGVPLLKIR